MQGPTLSGRKGECSLIPHNRLTAPLPPPLIRHTCFSPYNLPLLSSGTPAPHYDALPRSAAVGCVQFGTASIRYGHQTRGTSRLVCWRKAVGKKHRVFAWCSLGVLFSCGFLGAQTSLAPAQPVQEEPGARCLESTCRNAPVRETLSVIHLGSKYVRGIIGGFEQGAGIGGGVQFTSADAIPALELRATTLTSTQFYRRLDLEGYFPNIGGSQNHADVWFSYMRRESDFFGIGPRTSRDLKTNFATEERSYQGSLYRDLADHFQGGVYTQVREFSQFAWQDHHRCADRRQLLEHTGSGAAMDSRLSFEREDPLVRRISRIRQSGQHSRLDSWSQPL